MRDPRLEALVRAHPGARLVPYACEEDPAISWRLWILDVPRDQLCKVQDEAIEHALDLFGEEPLPLLVSVATPEKTRVLIATTAAPVTVLASKTSLHVSAQLALAAAATVVVGIASAPRSPELRTPDGDAAYEVAIPRNTHVVAAQAAAFAPL